MYFRQRLQNLVVLAGVPEKLRAIVQEGIQYGQVQYGEIATDDANREADEAQLAEDQRRFVISEAEGLLHHVSETLLRLYFAHEGLPACPWLEIARERHPGDFKRKVDQRFLSRIPSDQRRAKLAPVFHGAAERTAFGDDLPEADWTQSLDNIESFLVHYAQVFLEPGVYNAAKHGLAVRPGESMVQLGESDLLKQEGPSIEYLAERKDSDGQRRWGRATKWIDVERTIGFIYMATRLIEAIWGIGRGRYVETADRFAVAFFHKFGAPDLLPKEGVTLGQLHIPLLYYRRLSASGPICGAA